MFHPLLLTPFVVSALLAAEVQAGSFEEGEHVRLSEEMRRLAKRNAWKGVEAAYREMQALEGVALTYDDHYLAAQAARGLGDINAVHERLTRASDLERTEEVSAWLAELDASYGTVDLGSRRKDPVRLVANQMPFAPDQRASIEAAANAIATTGRYQGLLPAGEYSFGGQAVSVKAGEPSPAVALVVEKAEREPVKIAYLGPRFTLGPAFTSAGDPSEVSWNPDAFQPSGWNGVGGRAGVGIEAGFGRHLGVMAEVGWHGGFGSPIADTEGITTELGEPYEVRGASLNAGYGFLGLGFRAGDWWLNAGPLWSVGSAYTSEVVGEDAQAGCAGCVVAARGTVMAPGVLVGVSRALATLGPLEGALTLNAGGQNDGSRLYTWGQLAFTLAPRRSN
ncbi:MAG: hypothetical protein JXB39_07475 [Deltaproteobacteria bacterium]|nr:hypothetical protein [Deltaproteobacteria bacterium]